MDVTEAGVGLREDPRALRGLSAELSGNGPRKPPTGGRIALAMDAFPPDPGRRDLDLNGSRRFDWSLN
jgi:hypothetical protein